MDRYPLSEEQRVSGAGDMSGRVQNTVDGWALSSDVGCVFIGMEGLIHSYQYIPSEKSKALIDKLIALFERMDLTGTGPKPTPRSRPCAACSATPP